MRVLVAEDEPDISKVYKMALEARNHKVMITKDGKECYAAYKSEIEKPTWKQGGSPFDVIVLDYRMPLLDGMEVAKKILQLNPEQRIIFASAYVKETLTEAIRGLDQVIELLQKPFTASVLVDVIEDKEIYDGLKKLMVNVKEIKDMEPTHKQIKELFEGIRKLQKGRTF
jgi:CheY-like chemotaxis protein